MELDSTQSYFHYKWLKISLICIVLYVKIMEIYLKQRKLQIQLSLLKSFCPGIHFKLQCVELKNSNSCIMTRILAQVCYQ